MKRANVDFDGDCVAQAVIDRYERLPKKGKPSTDRKEWTVLAGFVGLHASVDTPVVLSLGTGTKCLPASRCRPELLTDAHAEAVARRALFLAVPVGATLAPGVPFWLEDGSWNTEVSLVMYTSMEPCGSSRMSISADSDNKRVKLGLTEPMLKPGKGEVARSMSCSDKVAKWMRLGLFGKREREQPTWQGLVIGGAFENKSTLNEMLSAKAPDVDGFHVEGTKVKFKHDVGGAEEDGWHPSGLSLNWYRGGEDVEVTQRNGKKMGANQSAQINVKHISRLAPMHRKLSTTPDEQTQYNELKRSLKFCL